MRLHSLQQMSQQVYFKHEMSQSKENDNKKQKHCFINVYDPTKKIYICKELMEIWLW